MATLITTDQIQYWLRTGTNTFTRVTEANAFDPSADLSTYDPAYKDRMNQPSYVTGKKTSIELDVDLITPGALQDWLLQNEDEVNVVTDVVRVLMFRPAAAPADGFEAKMAAFALTQNPLDGSAGEAIRATGTLTMIDDGWTLGTFDPTTATFTPAP